ncbi:formamidopyrimidine-DNA glycosylase-like [Rhodamnia argentea]|uniref:Formamidopyrimidine-DNA glycosylase-like n=1 Tax=Rhodamnia argentea TaxID=178133 RepID=A0ABM3GYN4_9MYRT|nr:formamidopyrimidine-DNA glycosylase-like [Rhodamnia argentea]
MVSQVIEKAIEVGADSSQFPSNWIFHSREKKPDKAFVDVDEDRYVKVVNVSAGQRIDFITAGGRTTAYVPALQKLSGANAVNAAHKKGKQTSKRKKRSKEEEEEEEEDDGGGVAIEEDNKLSETAKSKNAHKPRGQGRKSSRKPKESDDESDEAEIGEEDENAYGNGNNKQKKRTRGAVKKKGPEKALNKKTQPARNSQKQKKRAK